MGIKLPANRAGRAAKSSAGLPVTAKHAPAALEQALREDWAARRFTVEYQPQINLRTRKVVRFEALLRWHRPGQAAVSPKYFIPLAEEIGMIEEIGQWVLEQACADARNWPEEIGIAVNAPATALRNPALPAMMLQALARSGLAASRLELEITETSAIVMDPESIAVLNAIHALGVRITIDDLDVGHASLRYLLYFPFDKIKVDGLYAAALRRTDRRGEAAREIMRSIANLCQNLKIDSLAEGVETPEQLAVVMEANFTEVQGYIFSASVPPDRIPETLRHIDAVWKTLALPPRLEAAGLSFTQVADAVNDIVIITDAQIAAPGPVITYVNPAFTRLTGYSAQEAIGKSPRMLQGAGTSRASLDAVRAGMSAGKAVHEKILNYTKVGAPYWLDMRIQPLRNAAGTITHFVSIERDITLDKRRLDELEYVADRDILTGIPNRRAFIRAIEAEIEACEQTAGPSSEIRPLCVAWIDVDRFKSINDSFGHAAGDAVLFRMADRLAANMRRVDAIGRLGGEEFAVCMPEVTIEDAYGMADRLRHAVSTAAIETDFGPARVTVSIGVAQLSAAEGAASLMARADAAMYEAKRAGGNRVCRFGGA